MDNAPPIPITSEWSGVHAGKLLQRGTDVGRGQIGSDSQGNGGVAVDALGRVRCDLRQAIQGQSQAVVQLGRQVVEQAWVVNCDVHRQIGAVDKIGILTDRSYDLGARLTDRRSNCAFGRLAGVSAEQCVGEELTECLGGLYHYKLALCVTTQIRLYHQLRGGSGVVRRISRYGFFLSEVFPRYCLHLQSFTDIARYFYNQTQVRKSGYQT